MKNEFKVSLSLEETVSFLKKELVRGSLTGDLVDERVIESDGKKVVNLIFVKHYWRASNHVSLTVTIDNFEDEVRVYAFGSGGGEGLFKFDWGASESFADSVRIVLKKYIIK